MNIWKILKIEPTTDKKLIKRAYAKQSKEVHPEENPKEFQLLYEAYHMALEYAERDRGTAEKHTEEPDGGNQENRGEKNPGDQSAEIPQKWFKEGAADWHIKGPKEEEEERDSEDAEALTDFFSEKLKHKSACIEKFNQAWERLCRRYGLSGEDERWEAFLESEEFKEIQMDSQVMERIAEGLKGKLKYEEEYHVALWEAYHFTEEAKDQYYGEEKLLYDILYPVIRKRKKERERKEAEYNREEIDKKRRKDFIKAGIITMCLVFIICFLSGCLKVMGRQWAVTGYMNHKYAGTGFSKPKAQRTKERYGERVYILHPNGQQELDIRVTLHSGGNGGSKYLLSDDYGEQLIQQYAEPYGLKVRAEVDSWYGRYGQEVYIFYYEDGDDISRFCQSFYEMLMVQGDENLSFLNQVSFCAENICYPEIMLESGRGRLSEYLTFYINNLPQPEELESILRKTYVEYMYHYEPWNLTPAQEAEYGPEYIAEGRKKEAESEEEGSFGPWWALDDLRKTEQEAGLYLPVSKEANYSQLQSAGAYTYYITSGNAYQYLKARGLPVSKTQDGRGFIVQVGEDTHEFKEMTYMKLNDIYELARRAGKRWIDNPS